MMTTLPYLAPRVSALMGGEMTEEGDERSTAAAARTVVSRRQVLGLGVATIVLASQRPLEACASPDSSARIGNQGSIVEFCPGADGGLALTSFRNAATHFEWVTPSKGFTPTFECSTGGRLSWRTLPVESGRDRITLRASSRGRVEARMELVAYADTGAFR